MGTLKIERIGGLAGFGVPGSRIKSSGELSTSSLSAADQAAVEVLFQNPAGQKPGPERDAFRYRISRVKDGKEQTIEVPEAVVPQALRACVSDKLL